MKTNIQKLKVEQDLKARRQVELTRYAEINWTLDLEPRLARLSEAFVDQQGFPHNYFVPSREPDSFRFQVNATCSNRVRKLKRDRPESFSSLFEDHACLVYSMHANGSVSVILYPHESEWGNWEKDNYTIAMYESPHNLMGVVGDRRIRKHIWLFLEVAKRSMAVGPVLDDGFIARRGKQSEPPMKLKEI